MKSTRRRLQSLTLAACAALVLAGGVSVAAAGPADATVGGAPVATAAHSETAHSEAAHLETLGGGYFFHPGDPMIFSNAGTAAGGYEGRCTGGYAIYGDSGYFLTGTKQCSVTFATVRGTDRDYGRVLYKNEPDGNALIRMLPGDDSYQIVRDPLTGRTPGDGKIVGWTASNKQAHGMLVGKMGVGTGWTEGRILGAVDFQGQALLCTTMETDLGDAGGPVWRSDSNGLRALGTIQAYDPATRTGCYRPIQETLWNYGASLDSFGPDQGRPNYGTLAPGMPWLTPTGLVVPVDQIPAGSN